MLLGCVLPMFVAQQPHCFVETTKCALTGSTDVVAVVVAVSVASMLPVIQPAVAKLCSLVGVRIQVQDRGWCTRGLRPHLHHPLGSTFGASLLTFHLPCKGFALDPVAAQQPQREHGKMGLPILPSVHTTEVQQADIGVVWRQVAAVK